MASRKRTVRAGTVRSDPVVAPPFLVRIRLQNRSATTIEARMRFRKRDGSYAGEKPVSARAGETKEEAIQLTDVVAQVDVVTLKDLVAGQELPSWLCCVPAKSDPNAPVGIYEFHATVYAPDSVGYLTTWGTDAAFLRTDDEYKPPVPTGP